MSHSNGRRGQARRPWALLHPHSVVAIVLLLTVACTPAGQDADWPPRPPEVHVSLDEYSMDYERPVPAGRVVFRFLNEGSEAHRASLVPLPEDMPPIDEQLAGDDRRTVPDFAEIHRRRPGEGGMFAVDLEEGRRYALVCFMTDDDGNLHAREGMNSEFRAGGPDAEPPDDDPN